ncbi:SusC/RagA family TonB-linked outer membrane protein [Gaoshiqia sp. Z1-71]|uniref:SusC/RagA family TonB-linked outer membrane protein n=1 Tax=Gaoshiqia hydrogeniformans TaxID=3290090 RepID=UPI003BF7C5FC
MNENSFMSPFKEKRKSLKFISSIKRAQDKADLTSAECGQFTGGSWKKVIFLLFLGVLFAFMSVISAQAQTTQIYEGLVVEANDQPIVGATVTVAGTTIGTITDVNGKFSIAVPAGGKVEVSFVGYISQTVTDLSNTRIVLREDLLKLDEVVVVGYGTQRVKDLTGAATTVRMQDVEQLPGASIIDALAGQVIGLNVKQSDGRPGATGSFTIRHPAPQLTSGAKEFGPLIVIDDVVQVNDEGEPDMTAFNMLDYSEIESMTVLKDASAAVYGARASNGVILVKTKRGQKGAARINYSLKWDHSDAVSHAKTMNAYQLGVFTNRMFNQMAANNRTDYTTPPNDFRYSAAELNAMRNLNYNWLDEAWHSASTQRHSLTVDGGSDKVTYFAGISYQDQGTNIGNVQDYEKWTFRTGGEIKVAAGLSLSASVAGYNSKKTAQNYQAKIAAGPWGSQSGEDEYVQLRHMPNFIPWQVTTDAGTFYTSPWAGPHYRIPDANFTMDVNNNYDRFTGFSTWNFFANEASKARKYSDDNGFNSNFSVVYEVPFIKGLSLKGTYAVNYANMHNNDVGDYYTLAVATNTNEQDKHLLGDYTTWAYPVFGKRANVKDQPSVIYKKMYRKSEQINFMISYNRSFGEHDVAFTGVVEKAENEGNIMQQTYNGILLSYNGVSHSAGTLNTDKSATYFSKTESGAMSYIGRLNYKYGNRYLAQFIIRTDASTKFAPENYWGVFPTGSVGWVASEEKFFKNSPLAKAFDFFKLRYTLGKTGRDNVEAWRWLSAFQTNNNGLSFGIEDGGGQANSIDFTRTANRNLKWDQTIKQNYGVDMNVLSSRLGLTVDYYYDKTTDLLMIPREDPARIDIGAPLPIRNYGKIDAWGWEFSMRWNDKIKQNLLPNMGPIMYAVGIDYAISWHEVKLGQNYQFDYTSKMNDRSDMTGYRSPNDQYGFKVWKGTSTGDGILRTQTDIDNYWAYLEANAVASGGTAEDARYFASGKDDMYVGMLAYQDLGGDLDLENKVVKGPNGRVDRDQDFGKLVSNRRHGANTKLSLQWGNFNWSAMLTTSWGGYQEVNQQGKAQPIGSEIIWSQFSYMNDMFDPTENPNGKYPSMAVSNSYGERSDFWMVSTFRCYVRHMTLGYTLPKNFLSKTGIDKLQLNLTGNNLWDFYNPYPDKFRNMYDSPAAGYPTLRTWTLGLNVAF